MKPRTQFFIVVGLLIYILGVVWFAFSTQNQESTQVFSATVNRDCAPWDGAAFMVLIPTSDGTTVDISIWQSPQINFPVTFSFPDDTGQVGNILLLHKVGLPEPLSGEVVFWRVNQEDPAEGRFDLVTEAGQRFVGQFKAEWGNEAVFCG